MRERLEDLSVGLLALGLVMLGYGKLGVLLHVHYGYDYHWSWGFSSYYCVAPIVASVSLYIALYVHERITRRRTTS